MVLALTLFHQKTTYGRGHGVGIQTDPLDGDFAVQFLRKAPLVILPRSSGGATNPSSTPKATTTETVQIAIFWLRG